ncbi:RagB/SusD family nutrient uptake outer membrane protein [Hymenobacter sp. B81]|uniref:RagB/SusD family nutrient uptake outer membrane protein n=1 Tax=Hymenobacter sp. B81 TaxID=3344878 RepID=UPI0037DCDE84
MNTLRIRGLATLGLAATLTLGTVSCVKDLDREPFYDLNTESVFSSPANQKGALARLYAGLVVTGQATTGDITRDLQGDDEGATSYSRLLWKLQELPSDEAAVAWTDGAIQELNRLNWGPENGFAQYMYNRIYFQIALCNDFIRQMSDAKLSERGISGNDLTNAKNYRNEARFLRALSYYHALDMFGNVPFVTENDPLGKFLPPQYNRAQLFGYVESELKALENELINARQNEYGRADKAAAWTLLARLYLNAEVYTGTPRYADVITYTNKVIGAGYSLAPNYPNMFKADNDVTSRQEFIFPIVIDGRFTQSFGGTTFLVKAAGGNQLLPDSLGVNEVWSGIRAKKTLPNAFGLANGANIKAFPDKRAIFFNRGQSIEISNLTNFRSNGWAVPKFTNLKSTSTPTNLQPGNDPTRVHVDTDFPLMRLADVYLMYAEATARGAAGGSRGTAVDYINALRVRAYGNTSGNISDADLTPLFVLNERARELYWEGYRRTDLIRYNRFAGPGVTYNWPWKGNVRDGQPVDARYNLYPIPLTDLTANPNLRQNPGY